jgi:hypothetical protein
MKKAITYFTVVLLAALAGCVKKDYPEPKTAGESVFVSRLVVNGQPVEMTAGKNGYFMLPSHSQDSTGVYNLVAEFKQPECTSCQPAIRIQINDAHTSMPGESILIDSALRTKSYPFMEGTNDVSYRVKFAGSSNKPGSSFFWNFGDNQFSYEINPEHDFKAGNHAVTLRVLTDNGESYITNTISVTAANELNAYISAIDTGSVVKFSANALGGVGPYNYIWEFGDGLKGIGKNIAHTYPLTGSYIATLRVTDAVGNKKICFYNVVSGYDASASAANFSITEISSKAIRASLAKTRISYTDANGNVYESDNASQEKDASLTILSVEDFQNSFGGQRVKKVRMVFKCSVFRGSEKLTLEGQEVVIGFTYN